ncbi:hypothetical protein K488DRAFT_90418 [Vararia minispora EC-137]|uniref:Uncharacterized protein n=1 Tax=Vararia minispora EC-137 TaxID=1314806 RepID=A0ACB8Q7R2_9AGAM|nr:hypothetical protein K488DRAFT_90418 [Vararia minispora EC-137]
MFWPMLGCVPWLGCGTGGVGEASNRNTPRQDLVGLTEQIGRLQEQTQTSARVEKWKHEIKSEGEDEQPQVVVISAGQSGLQVP